MKTIRILAGLLLVLTGVLHIVMFFQAPYDRSLIGVLVFGIIYSIIGTLLFSSKKYPLYLGLIIPLIGMTLSIIKFGIPELFSMLGIFKILGVTAVILCAWVLFKNR